jgi:hypothetical protein
MLPGAMGDQVAYLTLAFAISLHDAKQIVPLDLGTRKTISVFRLCRLLTSSQGKTDAPSPLTNLFASSAMSYLWLTDGSLFN